MRSGDRCGVSRRTSTWPATRSRSEASSSGRRASARSGTASRCSASSTASPCSCATGASCSRPSIRSSRTISACTSRSWRWSRRRAVSGHSKWSSIKHKKGAADAKRGQLFSKLSRAIIVAAKEGGADPSANLALQNAIEKARSYSMPKDNIERAIARGSGAESDAQAFETVVYEGYGPNGVAVIVEALTDNRNRTASEVRHAFDKNDGNLGTSGAVAWLFERRGVVLVAADGVDEDELTLAAAEGGADDVSLDGSTYEIVSPPEALSGVREAVEAAGFTIDSAELAMIPKTTVEVADEA